MGGVCKTTILTQECWVSAGFLGEISYTFWPVISRKDSKQTEIDAGFDGSVGSGLHLSANPSIGTGEWSYL